MITALEVARLRVEISRLLAETARLNSEVGRINSETGNLDREAAKIVRENSYWYPFLVAGSVIGGTAAVFTALAAVVVWLIGAG